MHFDKSDLQQLTPEYVGRLAPDRVAALCHQLREDLLRAHERLNQNPTNSSRPSSSQAPWEKPSDKEKQNGTGQSSSTTPSDEKEPPPAHNERQQDSEKKRKPGKQPGAPGFGRTQKFADVQEEVHKPQCCRGCQKPFSADAPFTATTGFEAIDLMLPQLGKIGIMGVCTKHIFGIIRCECGFETSSKPHRAEPQAGWSIDLGEWRLIGPTLLAFLVFAKLRLHLTIDKTKSLLSTWFGIELSKGSIANGLAEAGRAVSDLEPAILDALRASGLLHVDETSWLERDVLRWLWVAVGDNAVHYAVGQRTVEMVKQILGSFSGMLVTDGYAAYRHYNHRARCWAHLDRKAQGLKESWDLTIAAFGTFAVKSLDEMKDCVYQMREMDPSKRAKQQEIAEDLQAKFCYEILRHWDSTHDAIAVFCKEIINDAQAIFRVLSSPDLPLTNNVAESALRPMVLMRKISYGTKTPEGSRIIALLASTYETLQRRQVEVHSFLSNVFKLRRSGSPSPPLPVPT
jgi:transposase